MLKVNQTSGDKTFAAGSGKVLLSPFLIGKFSFKNEESTKKLYRIRGWKEERSK